MAEQTMRINDDGVKFGTQSSSQELRLELGSSPQPMSGLSRCN